MALPVVLVASGGLPITAGVSGLPVEVAGNGYGIAVTLVAQGGLGVAFIGGLGANVSAAINVAGDLMQTNLVGAALTGLANLAGNISTLAGISLSAVITGTLGVAGSVLQTNLVGAGLAGTISIAGDVTSSSSWDYDAEYLLNF